MNTYYLCFVETHSESVHQKIIIKIERIINVLNPKTVNMSTENVCCEQKLSRWNKYKET